MDDKNTFNVTPYLFDVFPRMVEAIGNLSNRLKQLIQQSTPDLKVFQIPDGRSEVAKLLSELNLGTDEARVKTLGSFSEQDEAHVKGLETQIEELRKTDPAVLIKQKNRALEDVGQLEEKLHGLGEKLSTATIDSVKTVCQEITALKEQAIAVSAAAFSTEPVQPIGTVAWKALIEAAIAYNQEAYPGQPLPANVEGVRCILCQQPLQPEAKKRLSRFLASVSSDIENKLKGASKRLDNLLQPLKSLDTKFFGPASSYRRTAEDAINNLTPKVDALIGFYEKRRQAIINSIQTNTWPAFANADLAVIGELSQLKTDLLNNIEELKKKDAAELIKKLSDDLCLLKERKILSTRLPEVLKALERLRWIGKASKIVPISHRVVTERQKALMNQLVGKGFSNRFRENCKQLGLEMPLDFKIAGAEGETNRKLSFETAGGASAVPSMVLSEGEQTAAALGDFLTEVTLNETPVGIIFDDPVSSMDHMRKELIAKRLVEEATKRQVIIFTHDIIFSHYLATEAERLGGRFNFCGRTVARKHDGLVGCVDELIFPHSHYEGEAATRAKSFLDVAKGATGVEQRNHLEKACGSLRTAYEDFVQRKLFNDIVGRWRENIKFTFRDLYVDEKIVARVDERMSALSRFIDAHSHSEAYHEKPLTVDYVESEIQAYHVIVKDYKAAKKAWEANKGKTTFI